jgi:hypothetical protein
MCLSRENGLRWGEVKWYYDFVAEHGPGVPEAIARRVRRGLIFRKQIERLQEAVTGAGGEADTSRSKMKRDIIDTLSGHFRCLNEQVTCSRVKPFLPGLLLPTVQVRIPTPITVHLDHCPECAEDLEALRDLGLGPEQLERLERLYQGPAAQDWRLCRKARSKIAAFVRGSLDEIKGKLLDHLCTCPQCRSRVYRSRQRLLENEANGASQAGGPDDDIPAAQLFDYAVPYGRTSAGAQPADNSRVPTGRAYLKRIQELDETIYGIAERTDSGVATVYGTLETDAQPRRETALVAEAYSDPYPGYPIHVQVIRGRPQPATPGWSPAEIKAAWQRATCNPQVRFLLKAAVAAAAVIPLTLLFLNTSTVSGITLAQMFKALGRADNVHVSQFYPPTGELVQDFWISRTANLVVTAKGQEHTLLDLHERKEYVYRPSEASVDIGELTGPAYARARLLMDACLGFTLNDIPPDAKWARAGEDAAQNTETYELTYSRRLPSGAILSVKCMIIVDHSTGLPRELHAYRRTPTDDDWHYVSRTQLQYLTDDEMTTVIKAR